MEHSFYMELALHLAKSAEGQTGVNPMVGAVVVKDGRIIGMGAHLRQGQAHAEVHALNMAGGEAEGSTVYVTLEPCNHSGLTPPCTERLIHEKVKRVVIAALDPNPKVPGAGVNRLRDTGIEVITGVMRHEAEQLNEVFNKFITTGMPYVTLKSAMTLDGKLASRTGSSRWISGEASRLEVHRLRHTHQAILVGIGTVLADNPSLTTRLPVDALNPIRVIIDARLEIPLDARVIQDKSAPTFVVTTAAADREKVSALTMLGVEVLEAEAIRDGRVNLDQMLRLLAAKSISSILVEGGGRVNGTFLSNGLVDKVICYIAPKVIGGEKAPSVFHWPGEDLMSDAIDFDVISIETVGSDIRWVGVPRNRKYRFSPEKG